MKEHTIEIIKYEPENCADCGSISWRGNCVFDNDDTKCNKIREL